MPSGRTRSAASVRPPESSSPQRRPLDMLNEHVRVRRIEVRVEAAQDHGVRERLERIRLAP